MECMWVIVLLFLPVQIQHETNSSLGSRSVVSFWNSPLHISHSVPIEEARQRYRLVLAHARFELHSTKPYQEVGIPLSISQYCPYVKASWSGKPVKCLVDTGTGSILWPQWMQLDSHQLDISTENRGMNGLPVRGEWVLSSQIVVGGLTLVNVPTEAMGVANPKLPNVVASLQDSDLQSGLADPILGMFTFLPCVMTIDYAHKKLILRNRSYDLTRQTHSPDSILVKYQRSSSGKVVLPGKLAGHNANFVLDTGCGWVAVSANYAHANLDYVPPKPSSKILRPVLPKMSIDLNRIHFSSLDLYVGDQVGEGDVCLGYPLFVAYRVTIDPFRSVVLFENSLPDTF